MVSSAKEVTLIFPPMPHIEERGEEATLSDFKLKTYDLWLAHILKKFGSSSDLHKVLPSNANPISLGLLCLSAYLKNRGVKVKYIHCDYLRNKKGLTWDGLLEFIIRETSTSIVCGFYSTTPMVDYAMQIAQSIKSKNPDIVVVTGGPHVTFVDIETINQHPYIDFVVRGEGEETLYEIVKNINQAGKPIMEIPGTTYRVNGQAKRVPDRQLLPSDQIPSPDFDILPQDYNLLLTDMYSRGCPFRCKFCAEHKVWKNRVRFRNPEIVVEELIKIRHNFNQDLIHLADSEIDASPENLKKLLDAIENKKLDCRFTVNLRPDAYKRIDSVLLKRMIKLGFVGFFIGVESASDYMLERMGRNSIFSDFLKTLDLLNNNNVKVIIPYLMLGFPGETEATLKETQEKFIELLEEGRISFLFPKIFIPYPGSDPYENPEAYSIKISKNWEEFSRFGFPPPFTSPCLSNEILSASIISFYERIYDIMRRKSQE